MTGRCCAFVYARLDSARLPSKALAHISRCRLVDIVFKRLEQVGLHGSALLTTDREVDDALAEHGQANGWHVVRGHHSDLISRTLFAIEECKADWFLRVNADSPLVEPSLIEFALAFKTQLPGLVSNLFTRTFPYGISVELVDAASYTKLASYAQAEDLEHVTQHLYRNADKLRCVSIENKDAGHSAVSMTIDTAEDLARFREVAEIHDLCAARYWDIAGLSPPEFFTRSVVLRSGVSRS